MPTIIFDEKFTQNEKTILTKVFRSNAEELSLSHKDFTVSVRKVSIGAAHRRALMTPAEKNHYVFMMNTKAFNLHDAASGLGHEMIHVQQYIRGDMLDIGGAQPEDGVTVWKGKHYSHMLKLTAYQTLPWEIEAHSQQPILFKKALSKLTHEERDQVLRSKPAIAQPTIDQVIEMLRSITS